MDGQTDGDRRTDGQTDGQNYDSQDRASIAASRSKKIANFPYHSSPHWNFANIVVFGDVRNTATGYYAALFG